MRGRLLVTCLSLACLLLLPLVVVSSARAADPRPAGWCGFLGRAWDVAVAGDYAYVAHQIEWGSSSLEIVNVSDPRAPVVVGSCPLPDTARGVAVVGDYAYVADTINGLQVVDITDPSAPFVAASCASPWLNGHGGLAVSGGFAYVANGGLLVIDVSNPLAPVLTGALASPDMGRDVAVAGHYAYVSHQGLGLQVIDVSDPAAPVLAGSCSLAAWDSVDLMGVALAGDIAYVANKWSGLQVVAVGSPTSPVLVGSGAVEGSAQGVVLQGDRAYVSDAWGLRVFDVSDPTTPTVAGYCALWQPGLGIAVADRYAYLGLDRGLCVIDLTPAEITGLMPDYGMPGTRVVIDGVNLGTSGTVLFGDTAATISAWSETSITCTVPARFADGPTNVTVMPTAGANSNALTFTVQGLDLTASVQPAQVAYNGLVTIKGELRDALGALVPGRVIVLQVSRDEETWTDVKEVSSTTGVYRTTKRIVRKTYFRWVFRGDDTYHHESSPSWAAISKARLTPPGVPAVVRHGVKYTCSGYLKPQHPGGAARITISFWRRVSGRWRSMGGLTGSQWKNVAGATKYTIWLKMSAQAAGRWRVCAIHRDADHTKSRSAWRYFTVE